MDFIRIRTLGIDDKYTEDGCYAIKCIEHIFPAANTDGIFCLLPTSQPLFLCEILNEDGRKISNMATLFRLLNKG